MKQVTLHNGIKHERSKSPRSAWLSRRDTEMQVARYKKECGPVTVYHFDPKYLKEELACM